MHPMVSTASGIKDSGVHDADLEPEAVSRSSDILEA
jgi:hypothetical protein